MQSKSRLKRSPIRKKRAGKPRRGRVVDKDYLAVMAEKPCLVADFFVPSMCVGRITVHHVRSFGSAKNDRRTLPLCEGHHLHDYGPHSIERLGKENFEAVFKINIEAEILRYNEAYEG